MNRSKLKNYAPQARRDFIQAMVDRAAFYGLTAKKVEPVVERGDVALIAGREHPRAVAQKRKQLEDRIKREGFEQTMEAMAYTWFNRLVAIRFMEVNGYLEHGYRVLSHPQEKPTPEILEHAEHVALPGLSKEAVIDLKLAGNKESELYRLLLTAQCNALHAAMPFLFEKIDDETELLLPDNLLHSDSLIRRLVSEIDEADWNEVEVIGWLYQFYISDKKNEVIGKVVASEDIPAATQLFTPNWIVKYLVQNTLGRQWLATYPQSALRQQMEYYIEPAEQTPEVQEQLKAITPTSLDPEELTLLDPACGSGHILVEAYDLFKAIYQERGHRAKDIPALILQRNLFGLEIDDRAAQLAAFALMMKARADDRRIFDSEAKPNVVAIQDSKGLNATDITHALNSPINKDVRPKEYLFEEIQEEKDGLFSKKALAEKGHVSQGDVASLLELFEDAKTFGSLIQIPPNLAAMLPEIEKRLDDVLKFGNLAHATAQVIRPVFQQAHLLAKEYNVVVANPPYMGGKYYHPHLKTFVNREYRDEKSDLYACFIRRNIAAAAKNGFVGMITIPNWMFLSSFEDFRTTLLHHQAIDTFVHNGRGVFGSDFGSCSFVIRNYALRSYCGIFRRLFEKQGSVASNDELEARFHTSKNYLASARLFTRVPGNPIAYWLSPRMFDVFASPSKLGDVADARMGLATGNNDKYVRLWHECARDRISFQSSGRSDAQASGKRWFPYLKGGLFRKWYGNNEYVVDWLSDGHELQTARHSTGRIWAHNFNLDHIFRDSITWSDVTSGLLSVRFNETGFLFDGSGTCAFFDSQEVKLAVLGYLNTPLANSISKVLNPTVHFQTGDFRNVPFDASIVTDRRLELVREAVSMAKQDWDSFETSWDFRCLPILEQSRSTVRASQNAADNACHECFRRMKDLEEENHLLLLEAFGLQDELSPEVPDDQITLHRPDRAEDIKRLLSYVIGCIMGRYSLDKPGLIYAYSGNQGFDANQYKTFRADDDGILPLLETDWGIRDDASNRLVEFGGVAWPKEHLEENLTFIAEGLGLNVGEQPRETIRRYLTTGFYKHHLSMYKKRPIYWLFSSGKQRAFQCLVYLHRYHEGTLARMRTEYVIPLQGRITAEIDRLEHEKNNAQSTSRRNKIQKQIDKLLKQQRELIEFDERLHHFADQKISLDLDDGVKANYAKFGDLLAEVKAITGGMEEE